MWATIIFHYPKEIIFSINLNMRMGEAPHIVLVVLNNDVV